MTIVTEKELARISVERLTDFKCLRSAAIFFDISNQEINLILGKIPCETVSYPSKTMIIKPGDPLTRFGVVLEGAVSLIATKIRDRDKDVQLMHYRPSEVFALGSVTSSKQKAMQPYLAEKDSRVLWIDRTRALGGGLGLPDSLYRKILRNMIAVSADEDMLYQIKVGILAYQRLDDRVLAYMSAMSIYTGNGKTIATGMNHEQFAAHLCVNRTSLTHALAEMKAKGIISYKSIEKALTITVL
jgi:CRP-like cAMP-binding protein